MSLWCMSGPRTNAARANAQCQLSSYVVVKQTHASALITAIDELAARMAMTN
jgi:hypothetical protein